jgi:hypothetical protein
MKGMHEAASAKSRRFESNAVSVRKHVLEMKANSLSVRNQVLEIKANSVSVIQVKNSTHEVYGGAWTGLV